MLPFTRQNMGNIRVRMGKASIRSEKFFTYRGGGEELGHFQFATVSRVRPPSLFSVPPRSFHFGQRRGNPFAITSHLLSRPFRFILVSFGKRRAIRIPRPLPRACNFGKSLIPSIPFHFQPCRFPRIPFLSVTNAATFVS